MAARRTLDKLALSQALASGAHGEALYEFCKNTQDRLDALEASANENLGALTTAKSHNVPDANGIAAGTVALDLVSASAALNAIKAAYNLHIADTTAHDADDSGNNPVAAADATDQASAETLANELKADYNLHRAQVSIHATNDVTNVITAADATELPTLLTLTTELILDYSAHVAEANAVGVDVASDLREAIIV